MRIVIAEDSVLFREGLARLLTDAGHDVVAAVGDAQQLTDAVRTHRPDLAIIDVRMPPTLTDDGARAARTLREELPGQPMLLLSQHVETRHTVPLVGSGAFGYLLKDRVLRVDDFLDAVTPSRGRRIRARPRSCQCTPGLRSAHRNTRHAEQPGTRGADRRGGRPNQRRHRQTVGARRENSRNPHANHLPKASPVRQRRRPPPRPRSPHLPDLNAASAVATRRTAPAMPYPKGLLGRSMGNPSGTPASTRKSGHAHKIVENLAVVHPTFMAGPPRIFEKVRARVMTTAAHGVKGKIFGWAFGVGRKVSLLRLAGQEPTGALKVQYGLADKLVFSKIRARMGGNIRFFVSGSATLNPEVQEWFHAAGLLVLGAYGLTETSAFTCLDNPRTPRFGTVGPPLPGSEVKIAADGEILVKGPSVMQGYHHEPEGVRSVVDGWFATGDIGELDDHGYLRITDRKKDLIKTSGGKYIAPQKVEGVLKAACPYVSQVVVHGEGRRYASALITLDPEAIEGWATGQGKTGDSAADLAASSEVRELIEGYVTTANQKLERWETIKRFEILPRSSPLTRARSPRTRRSGAGRWSRNTPIGSTPCTTRTDWQDRLCKPPALPASGPKGGLMVAAIHASAAGGSQPPAGTSRSMSLLRLPTLHIRTGALGQWQRLRLLRCRLKELRAPRWTRPADRRLH